MWLLELKRKSRCARSNPKYREEFIRSVIAWIEDTDCNVEHLATLEIDDDQWHGGSSEGRHFAPGGSSEGRHFEPGLGRMQCEVPGPAAENPQARSIAQLYSIARMMVRDLTKRVAAAVGAEAQKMQGERGGR